MILKRNDTVNRDEIRPSGRGVDELRKIKFEIGVSRHAEGSCLVRFGHTHVLCTASVEDRVPPWLKGSGQGWVTAEYGMLPRSTTQRMDREAARGKQSGRTQEIQRLIGRSLRAVVDLQELKERQVRLDCDVIQADGGTRTAAISGAYVALYRAFQHLIKIGVCKKIPFKDSVCAVSCGVYKGFPLLDLDYDEDSEAETDANFVMTGTGKIVEIQASAEQDPFSKQQFDELLEMARLGCDEISQLQRAALEI